MRYSTRTAGNLGVGDEAVSPQIAIDYVIRRNLLKSSGDTWGCGDTLENILDGVCGGDVLKRLRIGSG